VSACGKLPSTSPVSAWTDHPLGLPCDEADLGKKEQSRIKLVAAERLDEDAALPVVPVVLDRPADLVADVTRVVERRRPR
jgi:hypothetical protein